MNFLLGRPIFTGYVGFGEGTPKKKTRPTKRVEYFLFGKSLLKTSPAVWGHHQTAMDPGCLKHEYVCFSCFVSDLFLLTSMKRMIHDVFIEK